MDIGTIVEFQTGSVFYSNGYRYGLILGRDELKRNYYKMKCFRNFDILLTLHISSNRHYSSYYSIHEDSDTLHMTDIGNLNDYQILYEL